MSINSNTCRLALYHQIHEILQIASYVSNNRGKSRTRSQHYTTRLSRRRSCSVDNCYSYHVGSEEDVTCNLSDIDESCQRDNWYSKHVKDNDTLHSFHTNRFNSSNVHLDCFHCFQTAHLVIHIHTHVLML